MEELAKFLNSNFFIALVTLTVGSVAILLYRKQQIDSKRKAANTIYLEIVSAERLIESAKQEIGETRRNGFTQIPEHHYLMQMESWSKFKDLFVQDFEQKDWDRISNFYNDCLLFDEIITYSDSQFEKDTVEIRKNVHKGIYKYVSDYADKIHNETDEDKLNILKSELKAKKSTISELLTNADYMHTYIPAKPTRDLEKLIDTIDIRLSLDRPGQALKNMANRKSWFKL